MFPPDPKEAVVNSDPTVEPGEGGSFLARLSDRERQILIRAAKGFTDQAIANGLGISMGTIGTYWGRIRSKLGHFNRTELVAQYLKKEASESLESLREHNRKLQEEVEKKRELLLTGLIDILNGVIDATSEAIIVVDERGKIRLANQEAANLFGYDKKVMGTLTVKDLIPQQFREVHDQHRDAYHASPQKKKMGEHLATHALRKDGTEFPMTLLLSSTRPSHSLENRDSGEPGLLVTCIIRDLTKE
jgi:PAS domain S-box-containing protein